MLALISREGHCPGGCCIKNRLSVAEESDQLVIARAYFSSISFLVCENSAASSRAK
jgi:hypothetical protein